MIELKKPLVFFDLETTGVDRENDRIIDIALIKIHPNGTTETMSHRVNPEVPIPKSASDVHGITDEQVKGKPPFYEVASRVLVFITGCDIAGFNSNSFDVPLLFNEFARAGITWDYSEVNFIDVGNLFKILAPRTLEAAYKFYIGDDLTNAHSALADTKATVAVLQHMLLKYPDVPKTAGELAIYSNYGKRMLDVSGRFVMNDDNQIVFNFGANKGKPALENLSYLYWMQSKDFPPDTLRLVDRLITEINENSNQPLPFK